MTTINNLIDFLPECETRQEQYEIIEEVHRMLSSNSTSPKSEVRLPSQINHRAHVLTDDEIEERRSSAYDYVL